MKIISFALDRYQLEYLLCAFREKPAVISFWMRATKTITAYSPPAPNMECGKMMVVIDRMQRLFIHSEKGSFSVTFPFSVKTVDNVHSCSLQSGVEITSKLSSEVISILESSRAFESREILGFADNIMEASDDPDTLWTALSELALAEDGYLRVDHDPDRENGNLHPLHHLDVFYSQRSTFKLGLRVKISADDFTDILNIRSDCHFLGRA